MVQGMHILSKRRGRGELVIAAVREGLVDMTFGLELLDVPVGDRDGLVDALVR